MFSLWSISARKMNFEEIKLLQYIAIEKTIYENLPDCW